MSYLLALVSELEKCREPGDAMAGWSIARSHELWGIRVTAVDGRAHTVEAPTLRDCCQQLGQAMIEIATEGAPEA